MLRNYFKIALRNLTRNKVFSFINIAGLAIGLAGFVLISTYIKNELSYDNFHPNAERIFRPVEIQRPPGIDRQDVAVTMGPLAPALLADFPEIENATRIMPIGTTFCRFGEKGFYEESVAVADEAFFDIFGVNFLQGNPETALVNPNSVVISEEVAEKYFPEGGGLNEVLTLETWAGTMEMTITGIVENYPKNSHLTFRVLASIQPFIEKFSWMNSWQSNTLATYIRLKAGAYPTALETKFPDFIERNIPARSWNNNLEIYLQPITDVHLHSGHIRFQTYNVRQGSIELVYTFSIIALLILVIACINFMNLSTARSAKRAKEVGVRKTLGTSRGSLIYLFLCESLLVAFVALTLAIGIVMLSAPFFNEISGGRIYQNFYDYDTFIAELALITLVTGIIAGSYPALFLSAFRPVQTLKGNFNVNASGRSTLLRKALVVIQFGIAIVLIITTGIVSEQMEYVRQKPLGYNIDQVLYLPIRGDEEAAKIETLREQLLTNPNIRSVAGSAGLRGTSGSQGTRTVAGTNGEVSLMMRISYIDFDYIPTMEMEITSGRNFSRDFATDSSAAVIINETAVSELGWEDPIGKQFEGDDDQVYSVIGVVRDFHYNKMTERIEPVIMYIDPERFSYLIAKVNGSNIQDALNHIEATWAAQLPGREFEYDFLNENFSRMYRMEENAGTLVSTFAFLAIFVACLGLFGLASFTTEQKTREIGIRKVLGASIPGIIVLLSREFMKWVGIAAFLAMPVGYLIGKEWLANFAYRADISWTTFLYALLIAAGVAILSVGYQAIRAALTNPAKALRYE